MLISIAFIKKRSPASSVQAGGLCALSSTTKSNATRIAISPRAARKNATSIAKQKSPRSTALRWSTERFPSRTCASNTRTPNSYCSAWIWSLPPTNTGLDRWPKRPRPASRSMAGPKTHRACAGFWTSTNSPGRSSRYEYRARPSRCARSSRLHPRRSPFSLHCRDPFWLLHGAPVSGLHWRALGQAHDELLEQDRALEARADRAFSEERRHPSPLLTTTLSPDRKGEPSQSSRPRNRFHQAAHRHSRFRDRQSGVRVPRNRARQGCLFLQQIGHQRALPSRPALPQPEDLAVERPVLRR